MSDTNHNIAIPLIGKMAFRALHTSNLKSALNKNNLTPKFFVQMRFYEKSLGPDYKRFLVENYSKIDQKPLIHDLKSLRELMSRTVTIESMVRKTMANSFQSGEQSTYRILINNLLFDTIRRAEFLAPLIVGLEKAIIGKDTTHRDTFLRDEIELALVSGVGNPVFFYDGLFAREAKALGIPVIANIINYDNIVSRGLPGMFTPDKVTVWSKKMANDAIRVLKIPAKRVEVTGPIVFDRYYKPLKTDRHTFLTQRGLNPKLPTVFYGGTVLVSTYFEFLETFERFQANGLLKNTNLIVRSYPHQKVSDWAGIRYFKQILSGFPNVYFSDPYTNSADTFGSIVGEQMDTNDDELHGILRYSDVMINYFSTLALEASICDLPTINIGYNKFMYGMDPTFSMERASKFSHNADPMRVRASRVVRSDQELSDALTYYLSDKTRDSDYRKEYALYECEYLDGNSSQRLADVILSQINMSH